MSAEGLPEVPKTRLVATAPEGVRIVGIIAHKGDMYLATETGIYRQEAGDEIFRPVKVEWTGA